MAAKRYSEEFKAEAIKQVTERGYSGMAVADRLGIARKTLYGWLKAAGADRSQRRAEKQGDLERENQRLKAELRRVEEERDILKKPRRTLPRRPGEVRLHARSSIRVSGDVDVPRSSSAT